jgi:hypothetical protein
MPQPNRHNPTVRNRNRKEDEPEGFLQPRIVPVRTLTVESYV